MKEIQSFTYAMDVGGRILKVRALGIDVVAYQDPLGTTIPRIKIQIKRRESPASVNEIRELMGLLQKDGDDR
ncbi:MAG: restriction endonuclease [Syntrophales bacterium]|jgi:predicted Mrr-cat superfamily restriction endonuclease|nr:restriction endonuclease [Syntrophales bacterium]